MIEEVSDDKTEPCSSKSEDGEVAADVMESDRDIREQPDDVNETGENTLDLYSKLTRQVYVFDLKMVSCLLSGNVVRSEVFTFIHGGSLKKDPNQSLHKGDHFTISTHVIFSSYLVFDFIGQTHFLLKLLLLHCLVLLSV